MGSVQYATTENSFVKQRPSRMYHVHHTSASRVWSCPTNTTAMSALRVAAIAAGNPDYQWLCLQHTEVTSPPLNPLGQISFVCLAAKSTLWNFETYMFKMLMHTVSGVNRIKLTHWTREIGEPRIFSIRIIADLTAASVCDV